MVEVVRRGDARSTNEVKLVERLVSNYPAWHECRPSCDRNRDADSLRPITFETVLSVSISNLRSTLKDH